MPGKLIDAKGRSLRPGTARVNPPRVVCVGESLIDRIVHPDGSATDTVGGSPKNTAIALARLGVPTALLSRIGSDRYAQMIRAELSESGVDTSYLATTLEPTTIAIADVDKSGNARYAFRIDGHSDGTWSTQALPPSFGAAIVVVLPGSLSLPLPGLRDTFDHIFDRESERILVFDPNIRPALIGDDARAITTVRQKLTEWIAKSTIVKASTDDVEWAHPGQPLLDVVRGWVASGTRLVLLTDGPNGASALTRRHLVHRSAPQINAVDSIGAGDAFTAGATRWLLMHGIADHASVATLGRRQLEGLLDAGIRIAASTCTRRGADPPWLEDLGPGYARRSTQSDRTTQLIICYAVGELRRLCVARTAVHAAEDVCRPCRNAAADRVAPSAD